MTQGNACAKVRCLGLTGALGLCEHHEELAQNEDRYRRLAARAIDGYPDLIGVRAAGQRVLRRDVA